MPIIPVYYILINYGLRLNRFSSEHFINRFRHNNCLLHDLIIYSKRSENVYYYNFIFSFDIQFFFHNVTI